MKKLFIHLSEEVSPIVNDSYECSVGFLKQHAQKTDHLSSLGQVIGLYEDWVAVGVNHQEYAELLQLAKEGAKLIAKHGVQSFNTSSYSSYYGLDDALISFDKEGAGLTLLNQIKMKPLLLDFELLSYRQRLLRGGRQKEPVARAVMNGLEDGALVFDATAGLGRESMILAHAGAKVVSFERQLPIWIILNDALKRAQGSRFFPFTLPVLSPIGTIKDYSLALAGTDNHSLTLANDLNNARPEVIYYDPMFPERENSAQVKKDMFVFQQVIGEDKDIIEFLELALELAVKRVVLKRPSYAPPLAVAGLERSYFVDGGQCRFDCYVH
ncbi:class I SAM-dependent methyltransferase [Anaerobiospirillum sp. NML120448]|uniref:class I SAM-dependent methyltransferase n=1 Tax=Anaerobiospirillum sp. NML120448 TaxID=2932816 RepID=UPI001FF1884C|nr:class I SAM-dependent methyltransferase [Anaerobiospirillum sp. NML120448]MCK0514690.1 class I SAM-dependent methyltransferase [Anaerobiospirillum sp. NML120448]